MTEKKFKTYFPPRISALIIVVASTVLLVLALEERNSIRSIFSSLLLGFGITQFLRVK